MVGAIVSMHSLYAPSIETQLDLIGDKLEQKPEDAEVGEVWAVIPTTWLKAWKKHVGYASPGEDPEAVPKNGAAPGQIYIDRLCKETNNYHTPPTLRTDKVRGTHYEVVKKEAFDLFKQWYTLSAWSQGKAVFRQVVVLDGKKDVECNPVLLTVHTCGHDGEPKYSKTDEMLLVSRGMSAKELIAKAIETVTERYANEVDDKVRRVWYSNDSSLWTMVGTESPSEEGDDEAAANKNRCVKLADKVPELLGEFSKVLTSPRISLMVETRNKDGSWLRSLEDRVSVVAALRDRQQKVTEMDEGVWRSQLKAGDFCDLLVESSAPAASSPPAESGGGDGSGSDGEDDKAAAAAAAAEEKDSKLKPKWREAVVTSVDADDKIVVELRGGAKGENFTLARDSERIAKPYDKARDWRAQLRTKMKLEVHVDALALSDGNLPHEVAPIYKKATSYLYYIPKQDEWWIGDWIRQRHGYITRDMADVGAGVPHTDPLKIPGHGWTYYDPAPYGMWRDQPRRQPITITPKVPAANPEDHPEVIEIAGHTDFQKDKMGTWTRSWWFMAEVHRIDRVQGKVEVILKQQHKTYDKVVTDVIKGIDLYGSQINEPGTHLQLKKKTFSSVKGPEDGKIMGSVGLRNLGNSCYMNSMLQCLNAAEPIQKHMIDGSLVESEINTKNALGTGGKLAQAYHELVAEMWSGQFSTVSPDEFKDTIGQFAPQFANHEQQDSMELFNYLLDNLHEDLNRVLDKPFTETVDDDGQSDEDLAREAWRRFKLRNDSIVVDNLMGQFRSHLTCPQCKREQRKYDTYSSVALPLPTSSAKKMEIIVIPSDFNAPTYEVKIQVPKSGTAKDIVDDVCGQLKGVCELTPANSLLVEILHGKVYKTLYSPRFLIKEYDRVDKILDNDILVIYQVPDQEMREKPGGGAADDEDDIDEYGRRRYNFQHHSGVVVGDDFEGMVLPVQQQRRNSNPRYSSDVFSPLGAPRLITFDPKMTCKEVHEMVYQWAKRGLDDSVDPAVDVYPYHESGTFDPAAAPSPPDEWDSQSPRTNQEDDAKKAGGNGAVNINVEDDNEGNNNNNNNNNNDDSQSKEGDGAKTSKGPAYVVCLTDQAQVMRVSEKYWDVKQPFKTLPYTDDILGDLGAKYRNKIGLMVTFAPESNVGDLLEPSKPPVAQDGGEDDSRLTLDKCIATFAKAEQLSAMDTWYCNKCKDHVRAFKKMDLWSIPPILTLHLKRFQAEMGVFREKVDAAVHFDEYIDMTPHVLGPQKSQGLKYELFAVSNHIGYGINGGHYTAYAKVNGKWALYNDSSVTECTIDDVQTSEAYVLFYRRVESDDKNAGGGAGGGEVAPEKKNDGNGDDDDDNNDDGGRLVRLNSNGSSAAPDDLVRERESEDTDREDSLEAVKFAEESRARKDSVGPGDEE
jgi:ubiquitin carboxyl-terminal hydrolase 4/11/15